GDRHRLPAAEVLDVVEDAVGVRPLQPAADLLGLVRRALGRARGAVLAVLAQSLRGRAQRLRGRADLSARLRRALADLLADAGAHRVRRLLHFLLRDLRLLLDLLLGAVGGRTRVDHLVLPPVGSIAGLLGYPPPRMSSALG